ncbi:uncharacterized protein LOC115309988 isoform X2 [Ixodes scapularis]|uniref:uncharacterized protein LOC115309988 isoform X2 n=1 Tax=Ixodes scapularis TaxID=6945 RepID=UPI001161BD29|nr:uncharacterized protein LOC115309988 isoform X2 [Ixodes scapularis]
MFAHVRYVEDNLKAVVSVTLIRNFSPKSVSDYDKAHLYETYWRSPQGTEEGYYSALILQMEESKEDMIQNLLKSRGTALPVIFEDPKTAIQATHAISRKEKALAQKVARKKEMKAILGKRRQVALSETSDDDDEELVPRKLLTIEKQANAELEKELERVRGELAASRKELEEERKLRTALSWTLLSKFDDDGLHIAKARPPQQANVSTLGALPNISTPLAGKKTATHKPQGVAATSGSQLGARPSISTPPSAGKKTATYKPQKAAAASDGQLWARPSVSMPPSAGRKTSSHKPQGAAVTSNGQLGARPSVSTPPSAGEKTAAHKPQGAAATSDGQLWARPSVSTPPSAGRKTLAHKPQGAAATSDGQLGARPSVSTPPSAGKKTAAHKPQGAAATSGSQLGQPSPGVPEQVMGPPIEALHSVHTAENHAGDRGKDQDKHIEADLGEDLVECADWDIDWDIDEDVGGDVGGHFAEDGGDGNDIDENIRGGAADGDAVGENDSSSVPLFQVQEGQIHVGSNIFLLKKKFEFVFDAKTDSMCVKDAARTIWSTAELLERSVSGKPCKRYLKLGALGKKRMTPEKKGAVLNMYRKYIQDNPSVKEIAVLADPNLSPDKRVAAAAAMREARLKNMNKYIAEMCNDQQKKDKLARALFVEESEEPISGASTSGS